MPSTFVEQWLDPKYPLDPNWHAETHADAQHERIIQLALVAQYAHAIPRRLGGDATPAELARDKKLCKRLRNRWVSCLMLWDGNPADLTEYIATLQGDTSHATHATHTTHFQQLAITLDWHVFFTQYVPNMREMLRYVANNATNRGENKVANRYCNRILNELTQIYQVYQEIYGE